jgi:anthranilate synthase component 1
MGFELPSRPVYLRLPDLDFFDLFLRCEQAFDSCFFLESMGDMNGDSRFSVIGFEPDKILRGTQDGLYVDGQLIPSENPYELLREFIPKGVISRNYCGGLVGYLGYDAARFFEPALEISAHPDFDSFVFGLYTDGLIHDSMTGETFYFYYTQSRADRIHALLAGPSLARARPMIRSLGDSVDAARHAAMVKETREEILAGNTFQCQIGFRSDFEVEGSPVAVYQNLRNINPSPHMYYVKLGDRALLGASPELVFRLRQGEMETFPLAGTTRRGSTESEDRNLARTLLNDPKEIAEHNMLVDLHRNDLGRVARPGTVKVRRLMDIKRFSHVQHISSEVVGIISRSHDMFSGLASAFPAGTLSGAPKIESMKIIERVESDPRGPYGGAVGHFGFNGDCTFAIPIRSMFQRANRAFIRASGGIVFDSTPEGEYAEIQAKLASMRKALAPFIVS